MNKAWHWLTEVSAGTSNFGRCLTWQPRYSYRCMTFMIQNSHYRSWVRHGLWIFATAATGHQLSSLSTDIIHGRFHPKTCFKKQIQTYWRYIWRGSSTQRFYKLSRQSCHRELINHQIIGLNHLNSNSLFLKLSSVFNQMTR